MAYTKKTKAPLTHTEVVEQVAAIEAAHQQPTQDFEPVQWTEVKPNTYLVAERFTANINDHVFACKAGELVVLTDTEYNVLKRFIKE